MNVILCCSKMSLRERWFYPLVDHYTVYQAVALQELSILVKNRISFDVMLLHRPLLDAETMHYIRERIPACRLFILSDRPDEEEGLAFLRLGAVGYANSYISGERLLEAVRVLVAGSVWVNQRLMRHLITACAPDMATAASAVSATLAGTTEASAIPAPAGAKKEVLGKPGVTAAGEQAQLLNLTTREYEIARLVSQGASNSTIAGQLGITESTVKSHLSAIYAKTSTRSRLSLALLVNSLL